MSSAATRKNIFHKWLLQKFVCSRCQHVYVFTAVNGNNADRWPQVITETISLLIRNLYDGYSEIIISPFITVLIKRRRKMKTFEKKQFEPLPFSFP